MMFGVLNNMYVTSIRRKGDKELTNFWVHISIVQKMCICFLCWCWCVARGGGVVGKYPPRKYPTHPENNTDDIIYRVRIKVGVRVPVRVMFLCVWVLWCFWNLRRVFPVGVTAIFWGGGVFYNYSCSWKIPPPPTHTHPTKNTNAICMVMIIVIGVGLRLLSILGLRFVISCRVGNSQSS